MMHHFMAKLQFNVRLTWKEISTPKDDGNYFMMFTSLNHPFSRGHVHINSCDPTAKPTLDPKYLSHPVDLEVVARHIQFYFVILSKLLCQISSSRIEDVCPLIRSRMGRKLQAWKKLKIWRGGF